ncbi:alpha/beta hydrolase [Bradyrhizobium sp. 188]|uniref:alpha/beta fold hydrolase n=1 Tax=Bradyrhizobium sp. 188 TaxID=2782656 RepID=UPI001FF8B397|nr:alpha/beta hydrolase [Bradyrhizobium sp. 188]MCK1502144.1 alpha/beta hydrolase [Bradyrhizobium sp. 188]
MSPSTSVIVGRPGLLAAHIVADRLRSSSEAVLCALPTAAFASFETLLRSLASEQLPNVDGRMRRVDLEHIPANAKIWHFIDTTREHSRGLLERLRRADIAEFNVVSVPYVGGARWRWIIPQSIPADAADPADFSFPILRLFQTSLPIATAPGRDEAQEGALHFLSTLFDLKREIEERGSDYFEHRALRCRVSPDAPVNLIRPEQAAKMILAISDREADGCYLIASKDTMRADEFLERVGAAYEVSLLAETAAPPDDALHSRLDALFHLRLGDFASHLPRPNPVLLEASWRAAGVNANDISLGEGELDTLLQRLKRQQQQDWRETRTRAGTIIELEQRKETRRNGQSVSYSSIGQGAETVVMLNAFGQDATALSRLIERLHPRYRVLVWDLRGLKEFHSLMSIADHADDLVAILDQERVQKCHLIAWCTGPKVAVEFDIRHPRRVRSMVFLNLAAKCASSPPELDTAYEKNFESLCKVLEQRPALAQSVMNSLVGSFSDESIDLLEESEVDVSARILATPNRDLRQHVLRPFQSPDSVIRYVKQLVDFWNYDLRDVAGRIDVPVLLLSAEYDQVASPDASAWAAKLFRCSCLLHAQGATHYFLHDRADVVGRMIETFIEDPGNFMRELTNAHCQ